MVATGQAAAQLRLSGAEGARVSLCAVRSPSAPPSSQLVRGYASFWHQLDDAGGSGDARNETGPPTPVGRAACRLPCRARAGSRPRARRWPSCWTRSPNQGGSRRPCSGTSRRRARRRGAGRPRRDGHAGLAVGTRTRPHTGALVPSSLDQRRPRRTAKWLVIESRRRGLSKRVAGLPGSCGP